MTTLSNLRIIVRYRGVLRESPENQGVNHDGEQKTNIVHFCPPWHGGPDLGKQEEVWSRKDLDEMQHNLSLLSEHGVREFYQRAYRECAIINSHTFPPARAIRELMQAWKRLRKWRP